MIVIFEGMDGTGKSTQTRMLQEYLERKRYFDKTLLLHYHHMPSFNQHESYLFYKSQAEFFKNTEHHDFHIICDRFHFGEMVYGPIYREYKDWEIFYEVEEYFDKRNTFLFYFTKDVNDIINEDDGKSISNDKQSRLTERSYFDKAYNNSNIKNKIEVRFEDMDIESTHKAIVHFIKTREWAEFGRGPHEDINYKTLLQNYYNSEGPEWIERYYESHKK